MGSAPRRAVDAQPASECRDAVGEADEAAAVAACTARAVVADVDVQRTAFDPHLDVIGPDLATPPVPSAVDALLQICDALEHAHGRGVTHGDVVRRNVLVGQRDGTAKLIDFGQAVEGFEIDADLEALGDIASRLLPMEAARPASLAELRERLLGSHNDRAE